MLLELLLAIFIFRYLRKSPQAAHLLPKWDKYFVVGMVVSVGLLAASFGIPGAKLICGLLADAVLLLLLYITFTQKEFQSLKPVGYAVMPIIVVMFISHATMLISRSFYDDVHNYF